MNTLDKENFKSFTDQEWEEIQRISEIVFKKFKNNKPIKPKDNLQYRKYNKDNWNFEVYDSKVMLDLISTSPVFEKFKIKVTWKWSRDLFGSTLSGPKAKQVFSRRYNKVNNFLKSNKIYDFGPFNHKRLNAVFSSSPLTGGVTPSDVMSMYGFHIDHICDEMEMNNIFLPNIDPEKTIQFKTHQLIPIKQEGKNRLFLMCKMENKSGNEFAVYADDSLMMDSLSQASGLIYNTKISNINRTNFELMRNIVNAHTFSERFKDLWLKEFPKKYRKDEGKKVEFQEIIFNVLKTFYKEEWNENVFKYWSHVHDNFSTKVKHEGNIRIDSDSRRHLKTPLIKKFNDENLGNIILVSNDWMIHDPWSYNCFSSFNGKVFFNNIDPSLWKSNWLVWSSGIRNMVNFKSKDVKKAFETSKPIHMDEFFKVQRNISDFLKDEKMMKDTFLFSGLPRNPIKKRKYYLWDSYDSILPNNIELSDSPTFSKIESINLISGKLRKQMIQNKEFEFYGSSEIREHFYWNLRKNADVINKNKIIVQISNFIFKCKLSYGLNIRIQNLDRFNKDLEKYVPKDKFWKKLHWKRASSLRNLIRVNEISDEPLENNFKIYKKFKTRTKSIPSARTIPVNGIWSPKLNNKKIEGHILVGNDELGNLFVVNEVSFNEKSGLELIKVELDWEKEISKDIWMDSFDETINVGSNGDSFYTDYLSPGIETYTLPNKLKTMMLRNQWIVQEPCQILSPIWVENEFPKNTHEDIKKYFKVCLYYFNQHKLYDEKLIPEDFMRYNYIISDKKNGIVSNDNYPKHYSIMNLVHPSKRTIWTGNMQYSEELAAGAWGNWGKKWTDIFIKNQSPYRYKNFSRFNKNLPKDLSQPVKIKNYRHYFKDHKEWKNLFVKAFSKEEWVSALNRTKMVTDLNWMLNSDLSDVSTLKKLYKQACLEVMDELKDYDKWEFLDVETIVKLK